MGSIEFGNFPRQHRVSELITESQAIAAEQPQAGYELAHLDDAISKREQALRQAALDSARAKHEAKMQAIADAPSVREYCGTNIKAAGKAVVDFVKRGW